MWGQPLGLLSLPQALLRYGRRVAFYISALWNPKESPSTASSSAPGVPDKGRDRRGGELAPSAH